jgi:hypothetical protein
MDGCQLFLLRYNVLYANFLAGYWEKVPDTLLRQRPEPRLNSIAWNIWHLTRVEDSGLNCFVTDRPQVFDESDWLGRMNLPWRHSGSGMTFPEVDELNQRLDLAALRGYSQAVEARTREIVDELDFDGLDVPVDPARLRQVLIDEGLAHPASTGLVENYTGWSKARFLMTFGLTHSFQHLGEMDVLASLLDVEW